MKLKDIIELIISESGLILFESNISRDHAKLVVDTKEGITLNQLAQLTKLINKDERIAKKNPEGIRLEITSPGINYPMTRKFQFERNLGRLVRIEHDLDDRPNPVEGKVIKFQKNEITIKNKNLIVSFDLSEIEFCRLVGR